ncbi:MAG: hotdog domain-containing protein [Atribacterota bacterium]|nr:hotdog domain-containing protein [Atribacterota bacterium]
MAEFNLKKGLKGLAQIVVNYGNMAGRFSNPMPQSFATPMLVSLFDNAAIEAVKRKLPAEYITVATSINIKHFTPTPEGMTVTAEAELKEIIQNRLIFKVEAFDELEIIATGEVERHIINLDKFTKNVIEKKKHLEIPSLVT